jgi:hypothetical protein
VGRPVQSGGAAGVGGVRAEPKPWSGMHVLDIDDHIERPTFSAAELGAYALLAFVIGFLSYLAFASHLGVQS